MILLWVFDQDCSAEDSAMDLKYPTDSRCPGIVGVLGETAGTQSSTLTYPLLRDLKSEFWEFVLRSVCKRMWGDLSEIEAWMFSSVCQPSCPFSVSSTYILEFTQRSHSPAMCRAFCCVFYVQPLFLLWCQGLVWHLLTLLPFKWGGLLLKGLRGCSPCKADTHTADAPHPFPPTVSAPLKKKKNPWSPQ